MALLLHTITCYYMRCIVHAIHGTEKSLRGEKMYGRTDRQTDERMDQQTLRIIEDLSILKITSFCGKFSLKISQLLCHIFFWCCNLLPNFQDQTRYKLLIIVQLFTK